MITVSSTFKHFSQRGKHFSNLEKLTLKCKCFHGFPAPVRPLQFIQTSVLGLGGGAQLSLDTRRGNSKKKRLGATDLPHHHLNAWIGRILYASVCRQGEIMSHQFKQLQTRPCLGRYRKRYLWWNSSAFFDCARVVVATKQAVQKSKPRYFVRIGREWEAGIPRDRPEFSHWTSNARSNNIDSQGPYIWGSFWLLVWGGGRVQMFVRWTHNKTHAPCEAWTHDLQIMRLTRCLLRQRGPKSR